MSNISIGIPCFNEESNIIETYNTLKKITGKINNHHFNFIFVDNGSTDQTKSYIKKIALKDKQVFGIFLSRNFGPEASFKALIDYNTGEAIIILPCDLQDPPELIPEFINRWKMGYNIVLGIYTNNTDNLLMGFARRTFYRIYKMISNIEVPVNSSGFCLLDKKALSSLNLLPEKFRFGRGLIAWIGLKSTFVNYERKARKYGQSSYNFWSYIAHAERSFFGFSYLPLDLIIYLGLILVFLSFIFIIIYLIVSVLYVNPIKGSITILVSIIFFGGIQLLAISIIGKYIQVIVEESKSRPVYIIDEIINGNKKSKVK